MPAENPETVVIAGGTGMIGTALSRQLTARGCRVIVLTRNPHAQARKGAIEYAHWNVEKGIIDIKALEQADHVINLAGANVMAQRWTKAYKEQIINSRTESSRFLSRMLEKTPNRVKTFINGSAIGYYGEDRQPDYSFIETDPADPGFLGMTSRAWEASVPDAIGSTRVCRIRTGIVLGRDGGFIEQLKFPVRFGIAPIISDGRQIISWIHIDDLCRMILFLMDKGLSGNFNAVSPAPASNKQITLAFAHQYKGKFILPVHVPGLILKIVLGERAIEILKSTRVSCQKIADAGFQFHYPTLPDAMREITGH